MKDAKYWCRSLRAGIFALFGQTVWRILNCRRLLKRRRNPEDVLDHGHGGALPVSIVIDAFEIEFCRKRYPNEF